MLNKYQNLNLDKVGLLYIATFGDYRVIVNQEQFRRKCG